MATGSITPGWKNPQRGGKQTDKLPDRQTGATGSEGRREGSKIPEFCPTPQDGMGPGKGVRDQLTYPQTGGGGGGRGPREGSRRREGVFMGANRSRPKGDRGEEAPSFPGP